MPYVPRVYRHKITRIDKDTGVRIHLETDRYYFDLYDHRAGKRIRTRGYFDYDSTVALAIREQRRLDRLDAGIDTPSDEGARRPLIAWLDDWRRSMEVAERTPGHITQCVRRVERWAKQCKWTRPADMRRRDAESAILAWRANFNGSKRGNGMSAQTLKHYITNLRTFTKYLIEEDGLSKDPFKALTIPPVETDRRLTRRILSDEEFERLIVTTKESKEQLAGMSGELRSLLYLVAAWTGLRSKELASRCKGDFCFDSVNPHILLAAKHDKARRGAHQPMPHFVAEILKA
jgi:hypothetical protein